ncbi:MAG: (Fe-S)-binding protein [Alphaproteobacteria bacterium]
MLKKFHKEIEYCTYCPKLCRFACPVGNATGNETLTPWGRQTLLHLVGEGALDWNREVALNVYRCTTCMLCREYCDHELEIPPVMLAARQKAVRDKIQPQEVAEFKSFFSEHHNPMGDDLAARLRSLLPKSLFNPEAQVIYYPGCVMMYNYPQTIKNTFRLFEAMGVNYVGCYDAEVPCCGVPLRDHGYEDAFRENAEKLGKSLSKAKAIITGCPSCAWTLKNELPNVGVQLTDRIYHVAEFLAPLVTEGKLPIRRPYTKQLIYHDPCYLGRYLGIYDQPRNLLNEVCREPLDEFSWNRTQSYCCGGGGGIPVTNPVMAREIAAFRLREVHEGEKKSLVTACPSCMRAFEKAENSVEVLDLVDVLVRCI